MITVTERAKRELKALLINSEADPEEGLRLLPRQDGLFALAIDTEMSGDQVVEYENYKVLLVGIEYFKILDGKTIDCQETTKGTALLIR
jgi:Fe-S cluster assembly iron-binding protein IscA